jgi:hypothetical protein
MNPFWGLPSPLASLAGFLSPIPLGYNELSQLSHKFYEEQPS